MKRLGATTRSNWLKISPQRFSIGFTAHWPQWIDARYAGSEWQKPITGTPSACPASSAATPGP